MSKSTLPHTPRIPVEPFQIDTPQAELDDLKTLLQLTRIPKATYENTAPPSEKFGVTREWTSQAQDAWTKFDWRKWEERINAFPQFKAKVNVDGKPFEVHFMALFSTRKDARPIVFLHGWPGCFLEFLPMLEMMRNKFSAEELPCVVTSAQLTADTTSSSLLYRAGPTRLLRLLTPSSQSRTLRR